MIQRIYQIALLVLLLISLPYATFAQDTVFNRVVTVERDYQPEVQDAQAISINPTFVEYTPKLNPVIYSTYSEPLSIGYNLHTLPAEETYFRTTPPLNGVVDAAVGHRNSHLLFGYRIQDGEKTSLDLYADHNAYWGRDALTQSLVGMQFIHHFRSAELYIGAEGKHEAYTYYGQLHDGHKGLIEGNAPWQNCWDASAKIGIRSTDRSSIQYKLQTGYNAFIITNHAVEHQIQSHFNIAWQNDLHSAGVRTYVQNNFYSTLDQHSIVPTHRHAIRIEPFYEYTEKNLHLHAGINLDMNIGTGELLSSAKTKNLSFAPSPNLLFEYHLLKNMLHLYVDAQGSFGNGSLEEYHNYNRYLNVKQGLTWNTPRAYTPVDAKVGFKLRPIKTLLLDIYGGYAYLKNACIMEAVLQNHTSQIIDYNLWTTDYQRWKVGGELHYHYRDILDVKLGGNYYFYPQKPIPSMDPSDASFLENQIKGTTVFDQPNWDLYARIEANIDSHWSIYSENRFEGSRWAYLSTIAKVQLRPVIDLNIGAQYSFNNRLSLYIQLNDYINRKNDLFYGYQSQGIHFLIGAKYKF